MNDRERAERLKALEFSGGIFVSTLAAEFAAVRAEEREACAMLCDERERINHDEWKLSGESHWGSLADECHGIAAAIRERGTP